MPAFSNQAQLSYNGIVTSSNIATGEIVEVLSANKTSTPETYSSGRPVTYVVNLINSGTAAFTNLTVTDDLGGYSFTSQGGAATTLYPLEYVADSVRYYQNGALQAAPTVAASAPLTITGIGVPAGGTATVVYQAVPNSYAPLASGSVIRNTATISGVEVGSPITASDTVNAEDGPYLTIFKSVSPRQVAENGQLTYTFDIRNLGNEEADAADNVQVLDTFQPVLSNISVTYNGTVLPASSYSYNAITGEFSTNAGVITVPAATFTQDTATGAYTVVPGEATLEITGTI